MTIYPSLTAPYGSWASPISTDLLTGQTVRLAEPRLDGDSLYWLESRPQEKGRNALVKRDQQGNTVDLLPHPINIRSRVHEYGGGNYIVEAGVAYFVLADDQRVYRYDSNQDQAIPEAITPEGPYRYADFCLDPERQRLLCIREDHSHVDHAAGIEESNAVVAISLPDNGQDSQIGQVTELVSGADFYSNPRLSPDGQHLSWLCWNHPYMPWDASECWLAELGPQGQPLNAQKIAGGPSVDSAENESVFQPQWSPSGELYFVSDRNNWWNLYRWRAGLIEAVLSSPIEAEFATPQWVFGMSSYGFLNDNSLLCCYTQQGRWQLASIDLDKGCLKNIETGYSSISAIHCDKQQAVFLGASATRFEEVCHYRVDSRNHSDQCQILCSSSSAELDERYIASPQALSFTSSNGDTAHGFYYPPTNPDYNAIAGKLPPLIVFCHGGPTGATEASLNLKIQYWTSRGFAIFDINYRGSTAYGRHYRQQLNRQWGLADVDDVCAGAEYLVQRGLADPRQLAIKGSSAGGYTVLAALTFRDTFKAGASHYGIGDLETLARDTHKFEARYLDSLIGAYPSEQTLYQQRSPIHHIDRLDCPVIFLQGLEDKVVPPNQAQAMVDALKHKGIANAHVTFKEEGHGFRQGANIKRALEAELSFYGQVFGFQPADAIEPVSLQQREIH